MPLRTIAYSSSRTPNLDDGLSLHGLSANERQRVFLDSFEKFPAMMVYAGLLAEYAEHVSRLT
jgi:hypothetical protein